MSHLPPDAADCGASDGRNDSDPVDEIENGSGTAVAFGHPQGCHGDESQDAEH